MIHKSSSFDDIVYAPIRFINRFKYIILALFTPRNKFPSPTVYTYKIYRIEKPAVNLRERENKTASTKRNDDFPVA